MDIFLLGAGRPALGQKPAALKNVGVDTRALDWQIHSFTPFAAPANIHYLGGYHVDDVIKKYPQLNFTVIPDWEQHGVLHTLLKAPFTGRSAIAAYSDTLFRREQIKKMLATNADVIFCIDSLWQERYESRSEEDITSAEVIQIAHPVDGNVTVEFTGLIYFSPKAVNRLQVLTEADVGTSLVDLIHYLERSDFAIRPFDVAGHWAEFNSPRDIARFILGTKAETLARLEPHVKKSHIGKQVCFTADTWHTSSTAVLKQIDALFDGARLIVRSSAKSEDNWYTSNAGGFESLLNIDGSTHPTITEAIEYVINSYGKSQNGDDQILIQEFISNVQAAGVVFTCSLESGAPYYRFNFDDETKSTESVTAGSHGDLRTVTVSRFGTAHLAQVAPELIPVLHAVEELEQLLGYDKLDIEFAIDHNGLVHIFQVRPVTVDHSEYEIDGVSVKESLDANRCYFRNQQHPSPYHFGERNLFANMPDWNPAEIIGTRPKPLAFSLYRELITNDTWARQRAEYGYRDVRPATLIVSLSGQPYVDARASLNSFIPAALSRECAARLANAYINILADSPQYHDKIEFDVVFTIWTPAFTHIASERLLPYGVTADDITQLEASLKTITRAALVRLDKDTASVTQLHMRRNAITISTLPTADKIIALLDDCKRFGTLAFAHAARAGFVATTLLKSLVSVNILTEERRLLFLKSFCTVAGEFEHDKRSHLRGELSLQEMIDRYGHLRPGTYELTAQAYWEDPPRYLVTNTDAELHDEPTFEFSRSERNGIVDLLSELNSPISPESLGQYLMRAIQARESVKFEFTRNLSRALDHCITLGDELGITRGALAYLEYNDLLQLRLNATTVCQLHELIERSRTRYALTRSVELPPVIQREADFYAFERFRSQPNFVTANRVEATIVSLIDTERDNLIDKLVMIPQADPGYDWLLGYGIAGLITQYGGANSHMAIRAAEIGLPAAIGVGEKLYEKIANMDRVELDCANQIIRPLQ